MGSTFTYGADRKAIIKEILTPFETESVRYDPVRKCLRGNHMYSLWEALPKNGEDSYFFVQISILMADEIGWGHKTMDESMGPYYHNCPKAYLDERVYPTGPITNDYARQWRDRCNQRNLA